MEQGDTLRYSFVPGQKTRYLFRSSYSSQTPGSSDGVISVSQELEIAQTIVAGLPGGRARVGLVIERFKAVTSRPGQPSVEFDSGKDPAGEHCPSELRGMALLVGKEIELVQSATGEVHAVSGLAAIYTEAKSRLSPKELQPLEHFLREFSRKPRGLFGMGATFPREPVIPPGQWRADRGPFPLFCGQQVYPCRYEFHDAWGGMARIEFADDLGQAQEIAESRWQPLWTTQVRGTISFDMEKGVVSQMRGESTTYLRVGEKMELRSKTVWELTSVNGDASATTSTGQSAVERESGE
jgi:hypothetical protein